MTAAPLRRERGTAYSATRDDTRATPSTRCHTTWYDDVMGIRQYAPDWIDVEPARLDDGRLGALLRVPENDTDIVELTLPLSILGQLTADVDEIRSTAAAWG